MASNFQKLFKLSSYKKLYRNIKKYGPNFLTYTVIHNGFPEYILYNKWYDQQKPKDDEIAEQRVHKFDYSPKISIVVPVYNTPLNYFDQMIQSVQTQTYTNWELCIANASPENNELCLKLAQYSKDDSRIKVVTLKENLGIAENTNKSIELATGEYIAFMDHDDILPLQALYEVVLANQEEQHDILYTDEDFISQNLHYKHSPQLKPDWSPHLLECHNYITHFFIVKKILLDKVGKLNDKYDGAQDYDLVLRCTDASKDIYHIPHVLYHWRAHKGSVAGKSSSKMYAYEAGKAALEAHFQRRGIDVKVQPGNLLGYYHPIYPTPANPLVSIIIPNKDHVDDLSKCINSIYDKSTYTNFEIVIAENNSEDDATFKYYDKLVNQHENITVVYYKGEFNYSAINNFAVKSAKGKYLLFLNNDTELITQDAIAQMLGCCMLPEVGAVGAKLLYEDNTVQHAGIVLGFGGFAGHVLNYNPLDDPGYCNKAQLSYDVSAVTGACLMTSVVIFKNAEGFSEEFKVAINDVDLCLKILQQNKYIICNNYVLWYHYESKSRGLDDSDNKKKERLNREVCMFRANWENLALQNDAYYNINFSVNCEPYKLEVDKIECLPAHYS